MSSTVSCIVAACWIERKDKWLSGCLCADVSSVNLGMHGACMVRSTLILMTTIKY